MRFKFIIFLLFVLLWGGFISNAQVSNLYFEHITNDNGLSQGTVYCIFQDSQGFVWLGTQGGLNKYNGYSFEVYKHDPTDTNSLSANRVFDIAEDHSGNLWIATVRGLNFFNRKSGKFTRYLSDIEDPRTLNNDIVYGVHVDRKGNVWAKTFNALNKLDTTSNKFSVYEHYVDLFSDYSHSLNNSYPIYEDELGNLWVGSSYGLFNFNTEFEQFKRFRKSGHNSIVSNGVQAILRDRKGNFWFGTSNGLSYYEPRNEKFTNYSVGKENSVGLSDNDITAISEDHNGDIWIGTRAGGLNHFNSKEGVFTTYRADENNPYAISNDEVLSIYEDRSYILWIGLGALGVEKIDMKKKKFNLYRKSRGERSIDLSNNVIASIFKNDDGKLWIGTWYSGLNIFDRKTGEVQHHTTTSPGNNRIVGNNVHVIFKDSRGWIWIGTKNGISIYENEEKGFANLESYFPAGAVPNLENHRIYSIIEDRYGNIWVGSHSGLHKFDMSNKVVHSFYKSSEMTDPKQNISNNIVQSIAEDHEGYLWIGTTDGLNRYNPLTGRFKHYVTGHDPSTSLSNNNVYGIIEASDGNLWIGTGSGLDKFTWKDTSFTYYLKKDGLADDKIYDLLEDSHGNIWFSTDRGVMRLIPSTDEVRCYDKDDGLQGLEFNNGASHKSFDGEMFFGGVHGLNSFFPDSMSDNDIIPPIVITSFEKTNEEGTEIISLQGKEGIEISYKDFMFTINFAALEYTRPEKNQYKYMMEGLNDDWIYIGTEHSRTFSNIPPSEYVFRVVGSNNDLKWNEKGASIKIIIAPPWWRTKWAYIAYILFFGFIIYYFIEFRTRKLKRSNQILQEKQLAALEIAKQKEELTIKNKNITDSINYAKRIQQAMMPSVYLFKKLFPESFILYKPKDIVSGDFYWITEKNNKVFVSAVDCTGHGVPGAFMSIIGFDLLRNITEKGIEDPAEILNRLNDGVSEIFSRNNEEQTVKDGMDIALCVIDRTDQTIQFAGAFNPLYLVRENKIIEVKANRFSVGMVDKEEDHVFENHEVKIRDNDMFYIFTDGYPDQFGGPLGKKFKYRRFRHLLLTINNLPVDQQKAFLEENIENWRGELEQVDDILVLGIRLRI